MTVAEMIIGVNLGVQKVDSNAFDNLLPEEILYYLNKASREYVKRQVNYLKIETQSLNENNLSKGFSANDNLYTLLINEHFDKSKLSTNGMYDNSSVLNVSDLSYDPYTIITGQARINILSPYISLIEIDSSQIKFFSQTYSNNPIFRNYPYVKVGDKIYFFYDHRGEIFDITLLYVKSPLKLVSSVTDAETETSTSELPAHTHDDIVNLTVTMILEDLKSARPYEQNQTTIPKA